MTCCILAHLIERMEVPLSLLVQCDPFFLQEVGFDMSSFRIMTHIKADVHVLALFVYESEKVGVCFE